MTTQTSSWTNAAVIALLIVSAGASIAWWLSAEPQVSLVERVPLETERGRVMGDVSGQEGPVDIRGRFTEFTGLPAPTEASWPRFRGADFRNISTEPIPLADSWPVEGPPKLWSVELGEGHAGAAVFRGRVYVLDYDETEGADSLRCFALSDGREIWRRAYQVHVKRNHGMSRTVPSIAQGVVVTIGPKCHVMCVDADTGDYRWGIDMVAQFGATVPLWYTGQCPLIDGDEVILAPGGDALLVGVDLATGKVNWTTPNPDEWEMSHASVVPVTLRGTRMFVYPAIGGTFGISAETGNRGSLLWSTNAWNGTVICPSAVAIDEARVFLSSGYGMGSMMLRVDANPDGFVTEPAFRLEKTVFGSEQQTPILFGDHIYGVLPKDAAALRAQLVCLSLSGELVWTSGKKERYGLGPYLIADGKLFVLNDNGELSLIRATPEGFRLLARAQVLDGRDAWAPMAIAAGRLVLRDSRTMICLDVRAQPPIQAQIQPPDQVR